MKPLIIVLSVLALSGCYSKGDIFLSCVGKITAHNSSSEVEQLNLSGVDVEGAIHACRVAANELGE